MEIEIKLENPHLGSSGIELKHKIEKIAARLGLREKHNCVEFVRFRYTCTDTKQFTEFKKRLRRSRTIKQSDYDICLNGLR